MLAQFLIQLLGVLAEFSFLGHAMHDCSANCCPGNVCMLLLNGA